MGIPPNGHGQGIVSDEVRQDDAFVVNKRKSNLFLPKSLDMGTLRRGRTRPDGHASPTHSGEEDSQEGLTSARLGAAGRYVQQVTPLLASFEERGRAWKQGRKTQVGVEFYSAAPESTVQVENQVTWESIHWMYQ